MRGHLISGMLVNVLVVATAFAAGDKDKGKQERQRAARVPIVNPAASPMKTKAALVMKTKPIAKFTQGGQLSRYQPLGYGKDEMMDVAHEQQADYGKWRKDVIHDLELSNGQHVPVALVEVGPPDAQKPTIVHFHGASVQLENVLLWRLARAFEQVGQPVRIVAPRFQDAERVIKELTKDGQKVATMGHSAGNGPAQGYASQMPDRVSHYIGIAGGSYGARGVKSLMMQGTSDGGSIGMFQAKSENVTGLALQGVDHSMRYSPLSSPPSGPGKDQKGGYNATPESAQVARTLARTVLEFVGGQPANRPFLAGLKESRWQGSFLEGK